jgi:hypothetical protein
MVKNVKNFPGSFLSPEHAPWKYNDHFFLECRGNSLVQIRHCAASVRRIIIQKIILI